MVERTRVRPRRGERAAPARHPVRARRQRAATTACRPSRSTTAEGIEPARAPPPRPRAPPHCHTSLRRPRPKALPPARHGPVSAPHAEARRRGSPRRLRAHAGERRHLRVPRGGAWARDEAAHQGPSTTCGRRDERAPTAIVAFSDIIALGVLDAARDAGVSVPRRGSSAERVRRSSLRPRLEAMPKPHDRAAADRE